MSSLYDYGKMIDQLNLVGLLPQTQLKMTVQLGPKTAKLPKSPYWRAQGDHLQVTLPWSSDLRQTTRLLSAVFVTLERLGQNTELGQNPFTLTWVLPEAFIHTAFEVIADTKNAPKYPEFHNGWYLRESLAWGKVQPQLQHKFGVAHGFDLTLLGENVETNGIVGLQMGSVPILANTSTGSQTTSLLWLQAALWGVLGNTLPDKLADWGTPRILDPESVRVIQGMQAGLRRQIQASDDGVHLAGFPQLNLDAQLLLSAALKLGKKSPCSMTRRQFYKLRIKSLLLEALAIRILRRGWRNPSLPLKPFWRRIICRHHLGPFTPIYRKLYMIFIPVLPKKRSRSNRP